jgi:hypothetical protein
MNISLSKFSRRESEVNKLVDRRGEQTNLLENIVSSMHDQNFASIIRVKQ